MPSVWSQSPYPRRTFDLNKINQDRIIMSIRADDTTNIGRLASHNLTRGKLFEEEAGEAERWKYLVSDGKMRWRKNDGLSLERYKHPQSEQR